MNQEATYRTGRISVPKTVQIVIAGTNLSLIDSDGQTIISSPMSAISGVNHKPSYVRFMLDGTMHSLEFITPQKKLLYTMFGLLGAMLMRFNKSVNQKSRSFYDALIQGGATPK